MQSTLVVYISILVSIVPIFCQDSIKCIENARKEYSEVTTCSYYDTWRRPRYNRGCHKLSHVADKTINCIGTSADYLKEYRESTEEGPSYPLTLKVIDSKIPVLPTSTFKHLKNITVLILENIELNKIMPGAFYSLEKLKEIYLGLNKLTAISDGVFNSLTALEKIDLSRNRIETITNDAFVGTTLTDLYLSNNNISFLGEVLVHSLSKLSTLDMSLNNLQNVSSFRGLSINRLNLSHNSIESVDFEIFPKTSAIYIDISFNKIIEIANFNLSNSYKLILSHNKLENFPTYDYESTSTRILDISYNNVKTIESLSVKLVEFYASFNFISTLSVGVFSGLHDLTHLYLDNNNLSSIPNSCFKDLSSLTHLNLSGNKLTQFKFGTFDNLKVLQVLDISNNKFKELPQYTFHSLNKLSHLSFQNNEINDINTDDLVEHMKMLTNIDLNNNTWSCQRLVNIVHKLSNRIVFSGGNTWDESNIHGIKCYESVRNTSVNISNSGIDLDDSKLNSFFNEDFTKSVLYKYFNQDFKNSEFYKYLENLRKSGNSSYIQTAQDDAIKKLLNELKTNATDFSGNFRKSEMYKYFNEDFRNSSFFKYMENFKYQTSNMSKSDKPTVSELDDMSNALKNFTKEIEHLLTVNNSHKFDFENSKMYNYFNKDFRASNFFKYLDSLNANTVTKINAQNISDSTADQLVSSIKINEYPTFILYVNTTCLMLILVVIILIAYRLILHENKYVLLPRKEEVELI